MWKKGDPVPGIDDAPKETGSAKKSPASFGSAGEAVIGPKILVKGDVLGEQDLFIEGRVNGSISLPKNTVTIGPGGNVKATVHAGTILVEGKVEGDLRGEEQIEIRKSGNVLGNIVAPRVGLEDGAQFKGNIDMEPKGSAKPSAPPAPPSTPEASSKDRAGGGNTPAQGQPSADAKAPVKPPR